MNRTEIAIVDHVGIKAGMECYDMELCAALNRSRYNCTVYSNFPGPDKSSVEAFRFRIHENVISVMSLAVAYFKVSQILKKMLTGYCILHGFRFGFLEWLFMRLIYSSGAGILLIVHDPESLIGNRAFGYWKQKMFELAEGIIVHNQYSKAALLGNIEEEFISKVQIIPHGNFRIGLERHISEDQFRSDNKLSRDKKIILFFGQIKETKGLDILLDAFAKTERKYNLVIAGRMRGHSFDKYKRLIDLYDLNECVKLFIDYISPEKRNMLFNLADAVVLPYRKVYQSGVMLMAMSCGKAVIASDLAPHKEIITDKGNGYLFRSEDSADLTNVLSQVMNDNSNRELVAKAGLKHVQENLNWDSIVKEWVKLFKT